MRKSKIGLLMYFLRLLFIFARRGKCVEYLRGNRWRKGAEREIEETVIEREGGKEIIFIYIKKIYRGID